MAGNVSIPNTFAAASGVVPAIRLDENWNVLRDYINAREITQGTLGSRPAASTSGRLYYATDTAQLFADTGTTWTQIGAPSGLGVWAVRRALGQNNTVTPLTQYDVVCDAVQLRNPVTGQLLTFVNPGTRTNNILTAGPAANGRDQAGAFSANTWIHLYYVSDGTTLATVSSIAGPTIGPTLPGGYTSWAYIGAWRLNASTQFIATQLAGSWVYYLGPQNVLPAGAATAVTAVSVAAAVPPTALSYYVGDFGSAITTDGGGALVAALEIHIVSGTIFSYMLSPGLPTGSLANSSNTRVNVGPLMKLPNVGSQFFYKWTIANGSAPSANLSVTSYQVGNGGE